MLIAENEEHINNNQDAAKIIETRKCRIFFIIAQKIDTESTNTDSSNSKTVKDFNIMTIMNLCSFADRDVPDHNFKNGISPPVPNYSYCPGAQSCSSYHANMYFPPNRKLFK